MSMTRTDNACSHEINSCNYIANPSRLVNYIGSVLTTE